MPAFRSDLDQIPVYRPGKPIDEVSRELGIDDIVKLASNEWPLEPFPEVVDAVVAAAADFNRYPENSVYHVVNALSDHLGVPTDHVWMGAGSTELLTCIALAVGGPGTSTVFSDPSFVMYPISAALTGAEAIPVPATAVMGHDLDAMRQAMREDTSLAFICNPNNPTGTYLPIADIAAFIESVPDRTLVVVDEAYFEFVTAADYGTAIPLAVARDNVIVTRTFSKVYGLAGLRVGYAVGQPGTLEQLRRAQVPFSVNSAAQAGALAALEHSDRLAERVRENDSARREMEEGLASRGLDYVPSQTNFVLVRPAGDPSALSDALLRLGVIVRLMGPFIRVTVGTSEEGRRFLAALDKTQRGLR
ncbi:MAG: histidinol-phosphate transaminase [Actinomycetota bacterium]|nr:histidinol-phosphate transaminase [Actinomycetota bacterium]